MINLVIHNNKEIDSDRQKAIATTRMINYAAVDAAEFGLKECSQLLSFIADVIKIRFNLDRIGMIDFENENKDLQDT